MSVIPAAMHERVMHVRPTHRLLKFWNFDCLRTAGRVRGAPHAGEPWERRRWPKQGFHPESLGANVLQHVAAYDSGAMG